MSDLIFLPISEQLQPLFVITYALIAHITNKNPRQTTHHENHHPLHTKRKKIHRRHHGRLIHPPAASPTGAMMPPPRRLPPKMPPHQMTPLQLRQPTALLILAPFLTGRWLAVSSERTGECLNHPLQDDRTSPTSRRGSKLPLRCQSGREKVSRVVFSLLLFLFCLN